MTRLPAADFDRLHDIRNAFAKARQAHEQAPSMETARELEDAADRRARAIRMVHEEDGAPVRHLAGMFRCSKTVIRAALAGGE